MRENLLYPIIVLAFGVLFTVFIEYIFLPLISKYNEPEIKAKQIVKSYFDQLNEKNYGEAYKMYSSSYQRKVSRNEFNEHAQKWKTGVPTHIEKLNDISSDKLSVIHVLLELTFSEKYEGNMYIIHENNKWKIYDNGLKRLKK